MKTSKITKQWRSLYSTFGMEEIHFGLNSTPSKRLYKRYSLLTLVSSTGHEKHISESHHRHQLDFFTNVDIPRCIYMLQLKVGWTTNQTKFRRTSGYLIDESSESTLNPQNLFWILRIYVESYESTESPRIWHEKNEIRKRFNTDSTQIQYRFNADSLRDRLSSSFFQRDITSRFNSSATRCGVSVNERNARLESFFCAIAASASNSRSSRINSVTITFHHATKSCFPSS